MHKVTNHTNILPGVIMTQIESGIPGPDRLLLATVEHADGSMTYSRLVAGDKDHENPVVYVFEDEHGLNVTCDPRDEVSQIVYRDDSATVKDKVLVIVSALAYRVGSTGALPIVRDWVGSAEPVRMAPRGTTYDRRVVFRISEVARALGVRAVEVRAAVAELIADDVLQVPMTSEYSSRVVYDGGEWAAIATDVYPDKKISGPSNDYIVVRIAEED